MRSRTGRSGRSLVKRLGEYDAAISAKQEAVRTAYRSESHPDADIAECHLLAGRRAEGDELFADLRSRTPDDVWLYNSAGYSYSDAFDPCEPARWYRDGIEVALRIGDPDQVVVQLFEGLERAWTALGESPEEGFRERVDAFVETWQPPPRRDRQFWGGDLPPLPSHRCEHCGYDPASLKGSVANRHHGEDLAQRVRELLAGHRSVDEKRMFGGLCFLLGGNMAVAASGQGGLLVRADPSEADRLVAAGRAEPMVMSGRPVRGWLRVTPERLATKRQLEPWVRRGVAAATSLPVKAPRAAGPARRAGS